MPDSKVVVRRTDKGDTLAAGTIHTDGAVEVIVAGQHITLSSIDELEARCAELSTTGVEVVIEP